MSEDTLGGLAPGARVRFKQHMGTSVDWIHPRYVMREYIYRISCVDAEGRQVTGLRIHLDKDLYMLPNVDVLYKP
jgi:hypothetical protein